MKTDTRIRMEAAIKTILKEGQAVKKIVKEAGRMQLYVWNDFSSDYTDGLAVAFASDEEEAKRLVLKYIKKYIALDDNPATGYKFDDADWGKLTVYALTKPFAVAVMGAG